MLSVGLYFRLVCTSGWFVLPVGLWEWKITNVHPILTTLFKNVSRTFEAEVLKVFYAVPKWPAASQGLQITSPTFSNKTRNLLGFIK